MYHVVRGGRVVKATKTPPTKPHPDLPPQPVTEAREKPRVTAINETVRPEKPELKSTAAPIRASGKSKRNASESVKTANATPTTPSLVVPNQFSTSTLEDISELLDHLPLHECVELTRRLFTSIYSLPTGAVRSRAVLKSVHVLVAEYGITP